jgi:hypothetical protein
LYFADCVACLDKRFGGSACELVSSLDQSMAEPFAAVVSGGQPSSKMCRSPIPRSMRSGPTPT